MKYYECLPPIMLRYSYVNLNGALSKLIPPGDVTNIKPKSICIIWPKASIRMLPLCLSFI